MADKDFKNDGLPEITRYEHDRKNVGTKKVDLWGYLPGSDEKVRLTAIDNGDGTYSLSTPRGLTNTELRASPVNVADINEQAALAYAEVLTATASITPTPGKRIKVVKAQILQSPANETYNLVTLSFASTGDFFVCWAGSDSNEWIGEEDEALDITLSGAQPVSVNIRYKEID